MNIKNRPLRFLKIFKISIAFTIILAALLIIRTRGKLVSRRVDTQLAPTAPQALVNKSPVIRSITLEGDPNGLPIAISGSAGDLWFSTWADDGNLYTTWGDGRGFGEILSDIGIARLEGDLPLITGENVYFEKHPGLLNLKNNDKPSSLLFIDGRLYGHFFSPLARPRIGYNAYSDDYGKTWTRVGFHKPGEKKPKNASPWISEVDSKFRCLAFVNMGQDYQHNIDGYVYGYGLPQPGGWTGGIYLTRVKKDKILEYQAYEYFTGMQGDFPVWSKSQSKAEMVSGLSAKNQISVAYHPSIDRFLFLTSQDLFDAPNPWGPWTYSGSWAKPAKPGWSGGYQPGIISKNMDANSFWFTISGQPKKGAEVEYKLNLGKIILEL